MLGGGGRGGRKRERERDRKRLTFPDVHSQSVKTIFSRISKCANPARRPVSWVLFRTRECISGEWIRVEIDGGGGVEVEEEPRRRSAGIEGMIIPMGRARVGEAKTQTLEIRGEAR